MVQSGDRAPEMALPTTTGQTIRLSDNFLTHKSVLLVFLRHLG